MTVKLCLFKIIIYEIKIIEYNDRKLPLQQSRALLVM